VYPDLNQPQDEYGRTLGVVYCGGTNANAEMIRSGRAKLYGRFCRGSVFGKKDWARELGCHD
jgi:endonuclease YncB( thermonuclease family)